MKAKQKQKREARPAESKTGDNAQRNKDDRTPAANAVRRANAVGDSTKISVLIVEDEPLIRMGAVKIIEDAGFEVIEAASADEAYGYWSAAATSEW
jgi:PleD family two-component response regulator